MRILFGEYSAIEIAATQTKPAYAGWGNSGIEIATTQTKPACAGWGNSVVEIADFNHRLKETINYHPRMIQAMILPMILRSRLKAEC